MNNPSDLVEPTSEGVQSLHLMCLDGNGWTYIFKIVCQYEIDLFQESLGVQTNPKNASCCFVQACDPLTPEDGNSSIVGRMNHEPLAISNQHQLQLSTTMNHHIRDDRQQQPVAFLSLSSFFSSSSLSSSSLPPHTSSGTGSQSSEF